MQASAHGILTSYAWSIPPARLITLPESAIHIWKASLTHPLASALCQTDLPPCARPLPHEVVTSSKLTRAYLHNILARYSTTTTTATTATAAAAHMLSIYRHASGKPYVKRGPHFNVAHTGNIALIAIANRPVGIDVEKCARPLSNIPRLLTRLTEGEAHAVRTASNPHAMCLSIWTRKEAFVKCTGEGIKRGLSTFDVSLSAPAGWVRSVDGDLETARRYWGCDVVVPDCFAAVVYNGRPADVVLFDWCPSVRLGDGDA